MQTRFQALTDTQWQAITPFTDLQRKLNLRHVFDALFYILRTGCQWHNLPAEYPHWQAVYYYHQWRKDGKFDCINEQLNRLDRQREGRKPTPSLLCADSQSVKLNPMLDADRGIDGHKFVNGRKQQLIVDTGGRLWQVAVHAANIADSVGGLAVVQHTKGWDERVKKVLTDQSYEGDFAEQVRRKCWLFEVASKPESAQGFVPIAQRWVVEPVRRCGSIAWSNSFRRIVKDYERTIESSVVWLLLANSAVMLNRMR